MTRVLLVCTGNVCRSPMAEGLLRKLLRDNEQQGDIVVESAGTAAAEGAPASAEAVDVAASAGVDLRGHVARSLSGRMVGRSDLILTMEPVHGERIVAVFPDAAGKTHLLTTFGDPAGDPGGIPDPIGWGRDVYEEIFGLIEVSLHAALPKICAMVGERQD